MKGSACERGRYSVVPVTTWEWSPIRPAAPPRTNSNNAIGRRSFTTAVSSMAMSDQDRSRWDAKYAGRALPAPEAIGPAAVFAPFAQDFPTGGQALDIACGPGTAAVWLAGRGLQVTGYDVSPVAIEQARALAMRSGSAATCRFEVVDLDEGLPAGPPADVVYCARFRDPRLDTPMVERLAPGGCWRSPR